MTREQERGVIARDKHTAWAVLAALHWTHSQHLSWPRRDMGKNFSQLKSPPRALEGRGEGSVTWCLSRAMAVRVSVETWREQYCTKRLIWHMAFPKIHVLFTNRT